MPVAMVHPLGELLAEGAFVPLDFAIGVRLLVYWTFVCCISTGGYFVFLAERKLPLLGFSIGLLGIFIYFVIFRPNFLPVRLTIDILVGAILFLFNIVGIVVMPVLFKYFGLDPPWVRIPNVARAKYEECKRHCSRHS